MNFFISDALAAVDNPDQNSPFPLILMLLVFSVIFYFIIFRPQQKRSKEHKRLVESISKGDEILTSGGLIGRVTRITDSSYITIALNATNEVIIKRDFVSAVLPKGTIKAL